MAPYWMACGRNNEECSDWELDTTAVITALSNFLMIPALHVAWRQSLRWEFCFGVFGVITSSLYHFCEPLNMRVYGMNEGQWHRLDNVAAIMCFANLFIYFMDNRDAGFNDMLKYCMLFWCLIQQERGPWQLENTIIPIVGALLLPIIKHAFFAKRLPDFHWRNFLIGNVLLVISFIFFAFGLDNGRDYLRLYHACWHVSISAASYWLWRVVLQHERKLHDN